MKRWRWIGLVSLIMVLSGCQCNDDSRSWEEECATTVASHPLHSTPQVLVTTTSGAVLQVHWQASGDDGLTWHNCT